MLASFTYGWCFMSLFCFSCLWLYWTRQHNTACHPEINRVPCI
jgi:hypothetical protein